MLGMMNMAMEEGVEFYAAKPVDPKNTNDSSPSSANMDLKVFTEIKEKTKFSYTKGESASFIYHNACLS